MARARVVYSCRECGARHPQWKGRCPGCQAWNSLEEEAPRPAALAEAARDLLADSGSEPPQAVRPLTAVDPARAPRLVSGLDELDRVLGGGLVPGGVVLLGGEPGVGKSTLALQLADRLAERAGGVLYVSGEESPEQIRLRADRLGAVSEGVRVLAETRVEALAAPWAQQRPALVLVDSIQTLRSERIESAAGSVTQVRESAALLAATAKAHGTVLVLVGHVTKDGQLAGPRVLEHLVDVVLSFEGDRHHAFRLLRARKNRFGSTQEVGVFQMAASGLEPVANPSALLLAERGAGGPGSCVVPVLEGARPLLLEVQALVAPAPYGTPRRTVLGVEDARVALLLAVLARHAGLDLSGHEVYVNAVGGMRVGEPGADLAVALALASSRLDRALPDDLAACGEIGLGGEVRRVARLDARLAEVARLGFRRAVVPRGTDTASARRAGVRVREVESLGEAIRATLRQASGPRPSTAVNT